jgi:hypothetical protein
MEQITSLFASAWRRHQAHLCIVVTATLRAVCRPRRLQDRRPLSDRLQCRALCPAPPRQPARRRACREPLPPQPWLTQLTCPPRIADERRLVQRQLPPLRAPVRRAARRRRPPQRAPEQGLRQVCLGTEALLPAPRSCTGARSDRRADVRGHTDRPDCPAQLRPSRPLPGCRLGLRHRCAPLFFHCAALPFGVFLRMPGAALPSDRAQLASLASPSPFCPPPFSVSSPTSLRPPT